jgi:hypothetical protein
MALLWTEKPQCYRQNRPDTSAWLEDHQKAVWKACAVINRTHDGVLTKAYSGEVSEMYVALPTQRV